MSDMMNGPLPALEILDTDGALRDSEVAVQGDTRAEFLRKAALGGAAVVGGGAMLAAMPKTASARHAGVKGDIAILNFALTLEYLEAEFYNQAVANINFTDIKLRSFALNTQMHENEHVKFLRAVIPKLGGKAVAKPTFNFGDTVTNVDKFRATAIVLEDTGVKAYTGQAAKISLPAVIGPAASILAVEAQHSAWIRSISGQNPAPNSFATGWSAETVLKAVKGTGFIVGL